MTIGDLLGLLWRIITYPLNFFRPDYWLEMEIIPLLYFISFILLAYSIDKGKRLRKKRKKENLKNYDWFKFWKQSFWFFEKQSFWRFEFILPKPISFFLFYMISILLISV